MDKFIDERDYKVLDVDKYTFFVLRRIIGGNCQLLLSDHERLIICFTGNPFPVWIWTPDDASADEMENAYQLVNENFSLNGEVRFNLKNDLAKYFIKRASKEGKKLSISVNMFAYDCPKLIKPDKAALGSIHRCNNEDIDELVDIMDMFHKETGIDIKDCEGYRIDAEAFINSNNMYFWKDEQQHNVASCKFAKNGDMASVNLVFTRLEYRRKHYAENLVYQVSKLAMEAGCVPMLYTDADYVASNACYEKIGYVLRGKLCTIRSKSLLPSSEADIPLFVDDTFQGSLPGFLTAFMGGKKLSKNQAEELKNLIEEYEEE